MSGQVACVRSVARSRQEIRDHETSIERAIERQPVSAEMRADVARGGQRVAWHGKAFEQKHGGEDGDDVRHVKDPGGSTLASAGFASRLATTRSH
jgi:hypothetical protein